MGEGNAIANNMGMWLGMYGGENYRVNGIR